MIFNTYNIKDESQIDHIVSEDNGKTWGEPTKCAVKHGLRNPQMAYIDGVFVAHGRSADVRNFVLYTSTDGEHWDEGAFIRTMPQKSWCYYSNNVVLSGDKGERMLIQFSESYKGCCVNVYHAWLTINRK